MKFFKLWLLSALGLMLVLPLQAHINPELHQNKPNKPDSNTTVNFREDCTTPKSELDQGPNRLTGGKINNIRARLRTGGDPWWDGDDGRYIAPAVDPGETAVSSIFAGGVWLGGFDPGGNLKIACQTYGNPNGNTDFWTGPLDLETGITDKPICDDWDRFFEVYATEIDDHRALYRASVENGAEYTPDMIPKGVKGWPARRNPYFFEINEFELPNTTQGLAGFFDRNGDETYDPLDGDFPVIEIRGCEEDINYPDQMIFWIYNDNGGIHGETQGRAIQMEIQVQAFAYGTSDEINDMTFQRYKLINRATENIDSTFFAMWVDADLGCYTDDYIGCDTSRSLAYTYNADGQDGDVGCSCPGGVATYCENIPIMGVDYFRGPLRPIFKDPEMTELDTLIEIGMSSFTYYNNGSVGTPPPGTTDPNIDVQYYNYLSGSWTDGSPFTFGDDAYQDGEPINYAFTESPNDPDGWSMCTSGLPEFDRRTIQASGPFLLEPGATNELIIGAVWVPDLEYPCPDITRLLLADDLAQNLFDNCFEITDGPDAPDVDLIELDQKLVLVLTNDTVTSNNAFELYEELDLNKPSPGPGIPENPDTTYNFEGYIIYQLADATVSRSEFSNPDKAREVVKVDVKNGISTLYNWTSIADPGSDERIDIPELQIEGNDEGIRHTFEVTEDLFASGNRRLINHKKYYYSVVAYGTNNWQQFTPTVGIGQKRTYLEGRRNIKSYTAIPRPIVDRLLNSDYGDGPIVTRLDGVGVGGNFVDMSDQTRDEILNGEFDGDILYNPGGSPIDIRVYNPLEVVDGEYELTFVDGDLGDDELDVDATWELRNITDPSQPLIVSDRSIADLNEQIIARYGFTVRIGQTDDAGDLADETNGAIGSSIEYLDENKDFWFSGIPDVNDQPQLNYVATGPDEPDQDLDPNLGLTTVGGPFVPFQLADHRDRPAGQEYITPGWRHPNGGLTKDEDLIKELNNVDIVFTSDKSKWSRCVIVETANRYYTQDLGLVTDGNAEQFELRPRPSVGKEDANGDNIPDADGETDSDGDQRFGMGWFPGYAIDVETGKRLNIFFGENTTYDLSIFPESYDNMETSTQDMMWNPTSQDFLLTTVFTSIFNFYGGGQHFIYVTNTEYDECEEIYNTFKTAVTPIFRVPALQTITWAGWPLLAPGTRMLPYSEGLIPNDAILKLRVDNPYDLSVGTGERNGYPTYRFLFDGSAPNELDEPGVETALDLINVVPNPYYGFSDYEINQFNTTVKITNLPAQCVVTIYTLDGKFIRQYNRDESYIEPTGSNRGIRNAQPVPDIDWDLKNNRGIPIAGGVYLIHIDAGDLGERVIKWFGTNRQFDPSGL
jgi:hypothetical protein